MKPLLTQVTLALCLVSTTWAQAPNRSSSQAPPGAKEDRPKSNEASPKAEAAAPVSTDAPAPSMDPADLPVHTFELTPAEAHVGELVTWRVKLERDKDTRVHLPKSAGFGGLEVHSKELLLDREEGGRVFEKLEVRLLGFEAGDFVVPEQTLTVVDTDGNLGSIEIPASPVKIKSLVANEPEPGLKEDLGPGEVVIEKDYTLLYILGALGAAGIIALLTLLVRRLWSLRKPKSLPPPPPPRPAEEIALEKLDALKDSRLLELGEQKEYTVRLSETVREYLGNRYDFESLELSSEELVAEMRRLEFSPVAFQIVLDFLSETDLIKFAKQIPTLDESNRALDTAYHLVKTTTPVVTEPLPEKEEAEHA